MADAWGGAWGSAWGVSWGSAVAPSDVVKTGTGGIDGEGHRRVPFKPTGFVDRPKKARKEVSDRVEESSQIQAEVAAKLAKEFGEETLTLRREPEVPIVRMSLAEVEFEIGVLLRKKIRTEEEEVMLLLMMAAG